jgi:DNA-binding CsgD family transcriptional regulator
VEKSRREQLLARYRVRSRLFEEAARRRGGDDPITNPALPPREGFPTKRELQVLALIAAGMTDSEIAVHLSLSPLTVKEHVRHLLQRLTARNRAHAVALGLRLGLITWELPEVQ